MTEHLELFIDLSETAKNTQIMVEKEESKKEKVLEMSIEELRIICKIIQLLKKSRYIYSRRFNKQDYIWHDES